MRFLVGLLTLFLALGARAKPVSVMLPLDLVSSSGSLNYDESTISGWFTRLKNTGVDGVMHDTWWGVAEPSSGTYDFAAYVTVTKLACAANLSVQPVFSFHRCGGNVGDKCNIPLPGFTGMFGYEDQWGHVDTEYVSLSADHHPMNDGRTPVQAYAAFAAAYARAVSPYLDSCVTEVQVGLGPCGEMRYPSYQLDRWSFPGVGAFQAWDSEMLPLMNGSNPPTDAGGYNSQPDQTSFFQSGGYDGKWGKWFLSFYAGELMRHAHDVLSAISSVISLPLKAKVAGIHWLYADPSHAAELTAGYFNTDSNDGYAAIAQMLSSLNVGLDFTCLEMSDAEQPSSCACRPQELVSQVKAAASAHGIDFAGENAIERYDSAAFQRILDNYRGCGNCGRFTFLRVGDAFWGNLDAFRGFVEQMNQL